MKIKLILGLLILLVVSTACSHIASKGISEQQEVNQDISLDTELDEIDSLMKELDTEEFEDLEKDFDSF